VIALRPESQATYDFRKIYWGGASYWLNVDVELRKRSAGHVTVDSVLARLRDEDRERGVWTMRSVIERLDAIAGTSAFSDVLEEAKEEDFPPFESLLLKLGVRGAAAQIELDDAAELAEVRRAIFAAPRAAPR
jgi:predicted metalloprotease with PDZ domain